MNIVDQLTRARKTLDIGDNISDDDLIRFLTEQILDLRIRAFKTDNEDPLLAAPPLKGPKQSEILGKLAVLEAHLLKHEFSEEALEIIENLCNAVWGGHRSGETKLLLDALRSQAALPLLSQQHVDDVMRAATKWREADRDGRTQAKRELITMLEILT